ncbi:MAG: hypothetical protein NUV53_05400 [Patescibacteria group bacterium]|nr:hypothetical protein [Patescibacteria group bacterium]
MQYQKSFTITEQNILPRVRSALFAKGFRVVNESDTSLQVERGSDFAQLYSFDIRKYKTSLIVEVDSANNLTFKYYVKRGLNIPMPDDQQSLNHEIEEILIGISKSEIQQKA